MTEFARPVILASAVALGLDDVRPHRGRPEHRGVGVGVGDGDGDEARMVPRHLHCAEQHRHRVHALTSGKVALTVTSRNAPGSGSRPTQPARSCARRRTSGAASSPTTHGAPAIVRAQRSRHGPRPWWTPSVRALPGVSDR